MQAVRYALVTGMMVGACGAGCGRSLLLDDDDDLLDRLSDGGGGVTATDDGGTDVTPFPDAMVGSDATLGSDATIDSDATLTFDAADASLETPTDAGEASAGDAAPDATDAGSPDADASGRDDGGSIAVSACGAVGDDSADCGDGSCAVASGVLDTTFAGTGYVTRTGTAGAPRVPSDAANAITIDSSCRIVAAGTSLTATAGLVTTAAWRVLPDGTFDSTFGAAGAWFAPVAIAGVLSTANAVLAGTAGLTRLAGAIATGSYSNYFETIWALTPGGALDPAFGGGGVALSTSAAGGTEDIAVSIRADSLGRFVLAGNSEPPDGGWELALWRYSPQGSLDTSYGASADGIVVLPGTGKDLPRAAVLDSQDRQVVVGDTVDGAGRYAAGVWRFTSSGALDTTFAGTGHVIIAPVTGNTSSSAYDSGHGVALDLQGRIVFAGWSVDPSGTDRAYAGRLTSDGALDTTFGTGGLVVTEDPADVAAYGMAVATDSLGRVVVAGRAERADATYVAAWRFTGDGALDATFAAGGEFTMTGTAGGAPGNGANDSASAVVIDAQNRVVIAGSSAGPKPDAGYQTPASMTIWRLTP